MEPVVGQQYSVACPTCYSTVSFICSSPHTYAIRCTSCGGLIDLRSPEEALPKDDPGSFPEGGETVRYSEDVAATDGLSAAAQVNMVLESVEREKLKAMPKVMTGETTQAFSAQRNQALAEKFSMFYPVTYAIEYLVFGTRPVAKIGHVRIFQKRIPFYGVVNIGVPKTTTSYAAPSTFTCLSFIGFNWFCGLVGEDWLTPYLQIEWVLVILFYVLLFRLAYSDPGYIKPGYMARDAPYQDELTLREIEARQQSSIWETVNGVPMERKWCATCDMHRPVRAAHCYLCGLCCYEHDHHCSVIGVCVGRRRMEMFALFVSIAATACVLPSTIMLVVWYGGRTSVSAGQLCLCVLMFAPLLMFAVVLSMTAFSMLQSILLEATTRERLQNVYTNKRNPFDRGMLGNLYYHCWRRTVAPSLFSNEFVQECQMRFEKKDLGTGVTVTCL